MTQFLDWLAALRAGELAAALGGYTFIESAVLLGLLLPADIVVLLAGSTVRGPSDYLVLLGAGVGGQLVGASLTYLVGWQFGEPLRRSRLGRWVGQRRWSAADRLVERHGAPAVALAHFAPVAHELMPLIVGTLRYPYRRFLAWSSLGATGWVAIDLAVGAAARASYREFGGRLTAGFLIGIAVAVAAILLVRRHRRVNGAGPDTPEPTGTDAPVATR